MQFFSYPYSSVYMEYSLDTLRHMRNIPISRTDLSTGLKDDISGKIDANVCLRLSPERIAEVRKHFHVVTKIFSEEYLATKIDPTQGEDLKNPESIGDASCVRILAESNRELHISTSWGDVGPFPSMTLLEAVEKFGLERLKKSRAL